MTSEPQIVYSRVNQAWFLVHLGQVLRVLNSKAEAEAELHDLLDARRKETQS